MGSRPICIRLHSLGISGSSGARPWRPPAGRIERAIFDGWRVTLAVIVGSSSLKGCLVDRDAANQQARERALDLAPQASGLDQAEPVQRPRLLSDNGSSYIAGDLEAQIAAFVDDYNHRRYHESIDNLTPADVYCGRGPTILAERERIKRQTIANRRLQHRLQAA